LENTYDIAIVGGGPAGAYCALELAKRSIYAKVFDHSHPREKPCGGGISPLILQNFPFLESYRSYGGTSSNLKLISCTGNQTALVKYTGFNMPRQILDQQILDMAVENGARIVKEEVLDVQRKGDQWQIKTNNEITTAKVVVGADGANSLVRKKTKGPITSKNMGLTYGYYATGVEKEPTTIKFVAEIPGYIWIFPRRKNSSVGIGSEIKYGNHLKSILDNFIHSYCPQIKIQSEFTAMLPWATEPEFFSLSCAGDDYILVGDAAGHVDPLSGEGTTYALWSGKLAAEAIAKNNLMLYDKLWKKQYGNNLRQQCLQKTAFFNPEIVEKRIALYAAHLS
jgi:geranylgeranyl reductase family protein